MAKTKTIKKKSFTSAEPKPTSVKSAAPAKRPRLPSAWSIARHSGEVLWRYRKLFLGITAIYALLSLFLVRGFGGGSEVASLKASLNDGLQGQFGQLATGAVLLVSLVTTSNSSSADGASAYQALLVIVVSLALIWALRHILAGAKVRIRDGFYQGMTPLVPVILVIMVIGLQLVPLVIGATLYSIVMTNGIAVHLLERVFWGGMFLASAILTFYMLCSSIFALYIATLPTMTPMKALRTARQLVRRRRLSVVRKVLFLPLALLVVTSVIMLPIVLWLTPLAPWIFFALTMLWIAVIHTYMYLLYQELLA